MTRRHSGRSPLRRLDWPGSGSYWPGRFPFHPGVGSNRLIGPGGVPKDIVTTPSTSCTSGREHAFGIVLVIIHLPITDLRKGTAGPSLADEATATSDNSARFVGNPCRCRYGRHRQILKRVVDPALARVTQSLPASRDNSGTGPGLSLALLAYRPANAV